MKPGYFKQRAAAIVKMRDKAERTFDDIAAVLEISRERVMQIYYKQKPDARLMRCKRKPRR